MDNITEIRERMLDAGKYLIPEELKNLHCDERITSRGRKSGEAVIYPGHFCYGFRLKNKENETKYCLRLWKNDISKEDCKAAEDVSKAIKQFKENYGLDCFVDFKYIEEVLRLDNGIIPGLRMEWGGETLLEITNASGDNHQKPTSKQFRMLADNFYSICRKMKKWGIVHGDLSALNVLVDHNWKIKFIDYDSLYIPSMGLFGGQFNLGTGGFQHPGRSKATANTMSDDNFSQLIIYISLLAYSHGIDLNNGKKEQDSNGQKETLLFSEADLKSKMTFEESEAYKVITSTDDPELQFYLDALKNAFDVPYDEVPFLCDLVYEPKEARMPHTILADYCGRCGHHFNNQTDLFCPDCGEERVKILN